MEVNDTSLLYKIKRQLLKYDDVNNALTKVVNWFSTNNLLLNEKKTNCIKLSTPNVRKVETNIQLKRTGLDLVKSTVIAINSEPIHQHASSASVGICLGPAMVGNSTVSIISRNGPHYWIYSELSMFCGFEVIFIFCNDRDYKENIILVKAHRYGYNYGYCLISTMCESESEDGFTNAKYEILQLFSRLDDAELDSIEQWICGHSYKKDLAQIKALYETEKTLIKIGNTIKKSIPFGAEMASETILPPTIGSSADCNEVNTCHIDEFLYDEDELEKLVEKGKIKRNYCVDCNSRNVKPLIITSHSMSRPALQYIFKVLLPKDLEDKQILDVGSRIGAVLYAAYYFSNASTIVGVEMNKECCEVQERIINQYSMESDRIKVIHSDVMERSDIVVNSDIIVINILDFFVDVEKQKQMWYFFKKHIRKGSYLVCNRSMADTLEMLDLSEELIDWLSICKSHQQENEIFFNVEDYDEIFLYTVN